MNSRAIAIISDTHLPRGRRALGSDCLARLRSADLIIHAGDFTAPSVLEQIRGLGEVLAVSGNRDEPGLVETLPQRLDLEVAGSHLGVIHDGGPARGRMTRLRAWFPDADAVIFGHSHIPVRVHDPSGFQIFNPGSPTDKRRQPDFTMGWAEVGVNGISFEICRLDQRQIQPS